MKGTAAALAPTPRGSEIDDPDEVSVLGERILRPTWQSGSVSSLAVPAASESAPAATGQSNGESPQRILPLVALPPSPRLVDRFVCLQRWEGYVLEVGSDAFLARLVDLTRGGTEEEAEILIEELDPSDHPLLEPGAVFYWSIGYLERPSGRQRSSVIRFRRLPAWTRGELLVARDRASEYRDLFAEG